MVAAPGNFVTSFKRFLQVTSAIVWSRSPPTNHSFPRSSSIDSLVLAIQSRIFPSSNQNVTLVAEQDDGERLDQRRSNIQEAKARGARIIALVTEGDDRPQHVLDEDRDCTLELPRLETQLSYLKKCFRWVKSRGSW